MMRRLSSESADFDAELANCLQQRSLISPEVHLRVAEIIADVRDNGDSALLAYARRFDQFAGETVQAMRVSEEAIKTARMHISPTIDTALGHAADRITKYHIEQKRALGQSWEFIDGAGNRLGQQVQAMHRVGLYAPGGKAFYPSTVLMTAIPARVAGVDQVVLAVPAGQGEPSPVLLAAAAHSGVDEVWLMGGAQAIAALAYGTES
ncbi:MAG: histidinol dehydrogenase, partial [Proteobacteria bacterium]|nr:histidinol dehydrogenase [Pseudomonadota bacterium]